MTENVDGAWDPAAPGVMTLPSGRLVRGRALWRPVPAGPSPEFGLYLLGAEPPDVPWESRWVVWPDFRLPRDREDAREAFAELLDRAGRQRVEVACAGGHGRTGTALACVAILDGLDPAAALGWVRARYQPRAVETWWQRRYVARFHR